MTRFKCIVLAGALGIALFGCNGLQSRGSGGNYMFTGFEPVEPKESPWYRAHNASGDVERKAWPMDNSTAISQLLPDQISSTTIKQYNANGTVSYMSSFAKAGAGKYDIIVDYAKYRTDYLSEDEARAQMGDGNASVVQVRTGVGVRVIASIHVLDAEAKIDGLFAVAGSAKANTLSGNITAQVIGIDAGNSTSLLPIVHKLDESSALTMYTAITNIQSLLHTSSVKLTPQVLAVKTEIPPVGDVTSAREEAKAKNVKALLSIGFKKQESQGQAQTAKTIEKRQGRAGAKSF